MNTIDLEIIILLYIARAGPGGVLVRGPSGLQICFNLFSHDLTWLCAAPYIVRGSSGASPEQSAKHRSVDDLLRSSFIILQDEVV